MREPRYGELDSRNNHQAYLIWLTRDDELPPDPWVAEASILATDPEDELISDYARKFSELLEGLEPRRKKVLVLRHFFGMTYEEIGDVFCLTRERIRQMEAGAYRILRQPARWLQFGDPPDGVVCRGRPQARHPGYAWELDNGGWIAPPKRKPK